MADTFCYCHVSIAPLRAEARDSAEMVSQIVFGETLEIIEIDRQWRKVRSTIDDYEGWTDEKLLHKLSDDELKTWSDLRKPLYNELLHLNTNSGEIKLTRGAYIGSSKQKSFQIGQQEYIILDEQIESPEDIKTVSLSYLNAPYLWGGKTLFGIDCSGFTQSVYRFFKIDIPRDANQQVLLGEEYNYEEKREGDLAFFKNSSGKIHHVGIVLKDDEIIHAHGQVRIDKLTPKGIFNEEKESYSHELSCFKRYF